MLLFLLEISNLQDTGGAQQPTGIGLNMGLVGCILKIPVGYMFLGTSDLGWNLCLLMSVEANRRSCSKFEQKKR